MNRIEIANEKNSNHQYCVAARPLDAAGVRKRGDADRHVRFTMLMVAPDSCSCRRCGVEIVKDEHISWAGGPYHLACTPLPQDWETAKAANFYRQPPAQDPMRKPWSKRDFATVVVIATIPILVLLWAMIPGHPYGYFIFLRWIVCSGALLFVVLFHSNKSHHWMYVFGFIALLYNPILRVHLTRDVWLALNMATIIAFVAGLAVLWAGERRIAKQRT